MTNGEPIGGRSAGESVFCAWGDAGEWQVRYFVRAVSRQYAKQLVSAALQKARFYR